MQLKKISLVLLGFLLSLTLFTQNIKDSSIAVPLTGLHFSAQKSFGDLSNRFGNTGNIGIPIVYKMKSNWIIGIDLNYFFGKNIKEENYLMNLKNQEGEITANDGAPGRIRLNERGINTYFILGRILPFLKTNKNSGPLVWLGAGYMQHKINIYDVGKNVPQLNNDLKKGYDRLTGGFGLNQFIGYLHLSNNKIANFYAGFEFNQAFTKGMRGYQYDLMKEDNIKRTDIQIGFRIGWILPLYKRLNEYYYY